MNTNIFVDVGGEDDPTSQIQVIRRYEQNLYIGGVSRDANPDIEHAEREMYVDGRWMHVRREWKGSAEVSCSYVSILCFACLYFFFVLMLDASGCCCSRFFLSLLRSLS